MSPLRRHLADYLSLRRALGHQLRTAEGLLEQFTGYLEAHAAATITIDHAVGWTTLPPSASAGYLTVRMSAVRGFAAYCHALDAAHQVPPSGLFPPGKRRAVPYLYRDADISTLMAAAMTLRFPLRQATCSSGR